MTSISRTTVSLIAGTLALFTASGQTPQPQQSADPHAAHKHMLHEPAKEPAGQDAPELKIPDLALLDQNGRKVRFYSDLVKGRVVAINFIFTTCTTICPPLAMTFSRIQKLMGERMGKDAHLISVSVDPVTDTPERLNAWAEKFGRRPGWTLVTGDKQQLDELLKSLGAFPDRREAHSPLVLIGNDASGYWTRVNGLAPASRLVKAIEDAGAGAASAPASSGLARQ